MNKFLAAGIGGAILGAAATFFAISANDENKRRKMKEGYGKLREKVDDTAGKLKSQMSETKEEAEQKVDEMKSEAQQEKERIARTARRERARAKSESDTPEIIRP